MYAPTPMEAYRNVLNRLVVSNTEQYLSAPIPLLHQVPGGSVNLRAAGIGVELYVLLDRNAVDDQGFALKTLAQPYGPGNLLSLPASPWGFSGVEQWKLTGSKAQHTPVPTASSAPISQVGTIIDTATYNTSITVSGRVSGNVTLAAGGTLGTARSANGTFTEAIIAGATTILTIEPSGDFNGAVDDVTVYPNVAPTDCDLKLYACREALEIYKSTEAFETVVLPSATKTVMRLTKMLTWEQVGDGLQIGLVLSAAYTAGKLFASIWARRFAWGPGL